MTIFTYAVFIALALFAGSIVLALRYSLRTDPRMGRHAAPRTPLTPRIGVAMLMFGALIVIVATLATRAGVA